MVQHFVFMVCFLKSILWWIHSIEMQLRKCCCRTENVGIVTNIKDFYIEIYFAFLISGPNGGVGGELDEASGHSSTPFITCFVCECVFGNALLASIILWQHICNPSPQFFLAQHFGRKHIHVLSWRLFLWALGARTMP